MTFFTLGLVEATADQISAFGKVPCEGRMFAEVLGQPTMDCNWATLKLSTIKVLIS